MVGPSADAAYPAFRADPAGAGADPDATRAWGARPAAEAGVLLVMVAGRPTS